MAVGSRRRNGTHIFKAAKHSPESWKEVNERKHVSLNAVLCFVAWFKTGTWWISPESKLGITVIGMVALQFKIEAGVLKKVHN